jgi:hypothetical protein
MAEMRLKARAESQQLPGLSCRLLRAVGRKCSGGGSNVFLCFLFNVINVLLLDAS